MKSQVPKCEGPGAPVICCPWGPAPRARRETVFGLADRDIVNIEVGTYSNHPPRPGIAMNGQSFLDRVDASVGDVVCDFLEHPIDYLFESDLQCALFGSLRGNFRDLSFISSSSDVPGFFGDKLTIHPVKSEYPYNIPGHTSDRFDLALLDCQQDPSRRIYHQHCRFGIEIKLWNPDGTGGSIWPDVKKLIHYLEAARQQKKEFSGLAILFVLPGAEKWLTDSLRSSLSPTIDTNEVSLHVVNSREKQAWACVPIPEDNETFQQITGFPRSWS
jgi:hypothetical protein